MNKNVIYIAAAITLSSTSAFAGVSNITENGSVSGNTAYKIQCSSGKVWRIWRSSGQWWDGLGAQGGQPRDLNEQASFLCR